MKTLKIKNSFAGSGLLICKKEFRGNLIGSNIL